MSYSDDSHPHAQETGVYVWKETPCRDCCGTGQYYKPWRPPRPCMTCSGFGAILTLVWRPHSQHYQDRRNGHQP
jgi:hypothetical protein